jgi:beta-galactosidase
MKKSEIFTVTSYYLIIFLLVISAGCKPEEKEIPADRVRYMYELNSNRNRLFDTNWKFFRGDVAGAELPDFDDYSWRVLDLPHDWSIEDLPPTADTFPDLEPPMAGPFTPASEGGLSTGFVLGGTGWYRKAFLMEPEDIGKIVYVRFDGVYMNADFWINGHHLGNHPYGYTSFYYDISAYLNPPGELNTLSVQVKNIGENSRWYSGSGIYRHVWLDVVDPVHVKTWGVDVQTKKILDQQAELDLLVEIRNSSERDVNAVIETRLIHPDVPGGISSISETFLAKGQNGKVIQSVSVDNPKLWSPDDPQLYLAEVTVSVDDNPADKYVTTFGIRTLSFSPEDGLLLNGKKVLLRGGNMHHDNGPLGAAAIDRAEYRRVELMKAFGYNAIRTSHNPPSPQFLDACDQLGMLVMDEAFDMWQEPKNPQDYHLYFDKWWERDLRSMILRDRHHPSVIIWSIGNEIRERGDHSGLVIARNMIDLIRKIDTSRPVTQAICRFWDHPGRPWEDTYPAFEQLDIAGYNYQWQKYESDHKLHPDWIMAGTESIVMEAFDNWKPVKELDYVIGDFLWTGMDYLGEASIGHAVLNGDEEGNLLEWPWFNANCGDIDLCGFKKPQSYYRDVVWGLSRIGMNVHRPVPAGMEEKISYWGWPDEWPNWNWPGQEGKPIAVSVYSSCDSVQLNLNGQDFGFKSPVKNIARYMIPYQPGKLMATGWIAGNPVDSIIHTSTGDPNRIELIPDRSEISADLNDLAFVTVQILDLEGKLVTDANIPVQFRIEGEGRLAGVGNGNPTDMKSFQTPAVHSFRGKCLVILQPATHPGKIKLTATAEGLEPGYLEVITYKKQVDD